jgi:hypothetical protein
MDYNFPKAGKPAVKQSIQTRVGNQGCGVLFLQIICIGNMCRLISIQHSLKSG